MTASAQGPTAARAEVPADTRLRDAGAQSRLGAALRILVIALAALAAAWPILAHPYLPLVDLPNHIARLYVAANPGTELARYYDYVFRAVPNAAADILWAALGHPASAIFFSRMTMVLYALNAVAATAVLSRVIWGRWSYWSAASGLLVYSAPFFWGFQNYLIGFPFALHAFSLWLVTEGRRPWARALIFTPLAFALLYLHLFAFAVLAVGAAGREFQRLAEAPAGTKARHLASHLWLVLPFMLPLAALVAEMTRAGPNPAGSLTTFGSLEDRFRALLTPFWDAGLARSAPDLNQAGLLVLAFFVAIAPFALRKAGARLTIAAPMRGPLLAMAALSLLAPSWVNGVAAVDMRFPVVFCLMFVAATRWQDVRLLAGVAIGTVAALILGLRVALMDGFTAEYNQRLIPVFQMLGHVPPGARVLPLRAPGQEGEPVFWHAQAYAVPLSHAFVPTLFQGVHALRLRPEWRDRAHPAAHAISSQRLFEAERYARTQQAAAARGEGPFWLGWERKFTHLLMLDAGPDLSEDPRLRLVARSGGAALYKVVAGTR